MFGWLSKMFFQVFKDWIYQMASDILSAAFNLILNGICKTSDINSYFDISKYLAYMQYLAGALLVVVVLWEIFKQVSGEMIPVEEKSVGQLTLQVVFSGTMIFLLPYVVTKIILPLNNILIKIIGSVGITMQASSFDSVKSLFDTPERMGIVMLLALLVMGIGFLVLGIAGGIRYAELLIAVLMAPIAAVSFVKTTDGIDIWLRETISIVFTQALQVLELQMLLTIIVNIKDLWGIALCVGVLVVMFRGPAVLRKYIYATGVGSASVSAAGSAGRMAAAKMVFSAVK